MAFDDVYQEAYIKFMEIEKRYAGSIDSPQWFMSLFKTALANKITDLANMNQRLKRQVCFVELEEQREDGSSLSYQESLIGCLDMDGELEVKLDRAPREVRQVLSLVIDTPKELRTAMSKTWTNNGKRMDGGNQFLCKMLGFNPRQVDLVELVQSYLEEE